MKSQWRQMRVRDFCPFEYGQGLKESDRVSSGSIPVYGSNGVVGNHDSPLVYGPGVIIGRKGTVGAIHYSSKPFWPIDTTFFVDKADHRDIRFTYYLLKSLRLNQMNSDSAVPGLNRQAANDRKINVPPLPEQRAIAQVLGSLDDKIELNRNMSERLEGIARAVFKSWFVNFDPVRGKAEGRKPMGMDAETAALFPDSFEDSGEQTPVGWTKASILELADLLSGGTPSTSVAEYWDGDIPWVSAKDVSNARGLFVLDTERHITTAGLQNSATKLLPTKTTIVTARGTVGSYCILGREMAMNQTNYGLKARAGIGDYFVYFSLVHLVDELKQQAYGTIFDTVTTKTFQDSSTTRPPLGLIRQFEQTVIPTMDKILANQEEARTLATLRDMLLPKLISGKVRVEDAEKIIEANP